MAIDASVRFENIDPLGLDFTDDAKRLGLKYLHREAPLTPGRMVVYNRFKLRSIEPVLKPGA